MTYLRSDYVVETSYLMKAIAMTRAVLVVMACLMTFATVSQADYPLRLIGYASADEQERVPGWVVRGMVAALRRGTTDTVRSEALLFPNALGILQQIPADTNAVIDALIARLNDGDPVVRRVAAQALGLLVKDNKDKGNAAIDALIARLGDADPHVRSAAAQALGVLAKDNKDKGNAAIAAAGTRCGF
jgi:hypothetical protein